MSIFGKDVDEAADKMNKATIKAAEFEGKGLQLQFIGVQRIKSQFGADEDATIVQKGILEEGEQFQFDFKDEEGISRRHWSHSMPFFIGMQQVELNEGDWIRIQREGKTNKDKRYTVEKIDAPGMKGKVSPRNETTDATKIEYPVEDINPDDIPF